MIQSQNDPLDKLEAKMDRMQSLKNSMIDQMLEFQITLPFLTNLMGTKNHGVLKTLIKIQFHCINMNLINLNP